MADLNWIEKNLSLKTSEPNAGQKGQKNDLLRVELSLDALLFAELQAALTCWQEQEPRSEFLVVLSQAVKIYFKVQVDGDPRLLVAHPDRGEFVATVALTPDHWQAIIRRFLDEPHAPFVLSSQALPGLSRFSNFEFQCTLANVT
jgi:hypothetical protein